MSIPTMPANAPLPTPLTASTGVHCVRMGDLSLITEFSITYVFFHLQHQKEQNTPTRCKNMRKQIIIQHDWCT